MARLARSTVLGYPHHVVQRGHLDQPVFASDVDYLRYLGWAKEYFDRYGVDVWAYCLLPNHVHFICIPKGEGALARAFNAIHMRYAQYTNGSREISGPIWRPRFMSCILDEPSVREEIRFVETNPVRSGLVSQADAYPWSSARSRLTGEPDPLLSDEFPLPGLIPDWRSYLLSGGDEAVLKRVRACLKTGRPAGNPAFVRELEGLLGRRLEALPRGRPRKVPAVS